MQRSKEHSNCRILKYLVLLNSYEQYIFIGRYVTNVLEDSKVYSQHSGKKNIDLDDVKLSVSMNTEQTFTSPPPREALLELARVKNAAQVNTVP